MNRRSLSAFTFVVAAMTAIIGCTTSHRVDHPAPVAPAATNSPASSPTTSSSVSTELNSTAATPPMYVPDITHENEPLPDGVLAWNGLLQITNVVETEDAAHFTISFTNLTAGKVAIMDVHPSCGCTTAELPQRPWIIEAGASGTFPVTVNLNAAGHQGTLFKSVKVTTDKGMKDIYLRITIDPVKMAEITEADRERFLAMSKADRQAIFSGDCASCHVKRGEGKYGKALYDADCAICHDAEQRATVVPDLHKLKVPTNPDFWRQWVTHGKPGSLMAAFSQAEGGPLSDMQIASLVEYLDETNPSNVPSVQ